MSTVTMGVPAASLSLSRVRSGQMAVLMPHSTAYSALQVAISLDMYMQGSPVSVPCAACMCSGEVYMVQGRINSTLYILSAVQLPWFVSICC
jgi:hypothetical protein